MYRDIGVLDHFHVFKHIMLLLIANRNTQMNFTVTKYPEGLPGEDHVRYWVKLATAKKCDVDPYAEHYGLSQPLPPVKY